MSVQTVTEPPSTRDILEAWRQSLGRTHAAFAPLLGHDPGNWSRIRRGLQVLSAESMRAALAQAEEPWRTALALTWLREHLGVGLELTARPSVGEPTAESEARPQKV
mgnify:CR=1 FL=1